MIAQYQDAMSIVSKHGKPDLFLTFTVNPAWPEITNNLEMGQTTSDRPDLVARVFQLKVRAFCDEIVKKQVLGEVAAYIYVIEFQKRGLPHMHMLLTLKAGSKLTTAAEVDALISAELPDPATDPSLHKIVSTSMIHRPCGVTNPDSPCMKKGHCSKGYPRNFRDETSLSVNGYPEYRRRNDGRSVYCRGTSLDNRSVVPYCPYLTLMFEAHINVEVCALIHAVKYLYKYVYKGPDRARIRLHRADSSAENVRDEIDSYWDTRYVCAPEAAHRILGFAMTDRSDSVTRLQVHLPNFETVCFKPGTIVPALTAALNRLSTLTAFFELNKGCQKLEQELGGLPDDIMDSRQFRYHEIPENYISKKQWVERKQETRRVIGRMHFVSPHDTERFALRLLLLYGKGFTSFDDVRAVAGRKYATFVEAAQAAGHLRNDNSSRSAMQEAAALRMPDQLRSFFVDLIVFTEMRPPLPEQLWSEFRLDLMEDYLHRGLSQAVAESKAFDDIVRGLTDLGKSYHEILPMEIPRLNDHVETIDRDFHRNRGIELYPLLNAEQKSVVDSVIQVLETGESQFFFVDGPGGSGKTFVYTTLYHLLLSRGITVLSVAWTGIAANLLPQGRTVTSAFRLVVQNDSRSSTMKRQSSEAAALRDTQVIIWDEAPMAPKTALETVDSLLQDIMQNDDKPFGGKVMVLGGDFRQMLPVVEKGSRGDIVGNCLKKSLLWQCFGHFKLQINMRLTDNDLEFRQWLLELGNGQCKKDISVPPDLQVDDTEDLVEAVFGNALTAESDIDLADCAILSPKNAEALKLNIEILDKLPGIQEIFLSQDEAEVEDPSDALNFPTEFLNKMTPTGLPPHKLHLKIGCIIMLLRNLDVRRGKCNGTRFIVRNMTPRILTCEFVTGSNKGSLVLIPKIDCYYSHKTLPFRLRRRQFPVRLSFCMTISKSQGQTFSRVGIYLKEQIFAHGQLYVALSRARTRAGIFISAPEKIMHNIVYEEVLS